MAQREGAKAGPIRRILPAILLFYALLLPDEVRFMIGQQTIYAPRFVYFLSLFWIVSNVISGQIKFKLADWLVLSGTAWIPTSFMLYYGFDKGFIRGTVLGLDVFMPYIIGRLTLRTTTDLRRFLVLVAPGVLLVGFSIIAESMLGHEIVKPAFASIFTELPAYENGKIAGVRQAVVDYRYGLLRVGGPFTHPILAAVFMASMVTLYLSSGLRNWPRWTGFLAIPFVLLTVSSSGVFFLVMAGIIILYDILQRRAGFLNWKQGLTAVAVLLLMMEVGSNRGIWGLLGAASFNPDTAFFRQAIWQYGSASVLRHPIYGIGFDSYERPAWMITSSVDNYWLALGIRHGLFVPLALLGGVIAILWLLARTLAFAKTVADRRLLFGLAATIGAMAVVEFTFFLFGGMAYWHYLLLGMAYSIALDMIPLRTPPPPQRFATDR